MTKPRSIFILDDQYFSKIYSAQQIEAVREITLNDGQLHTVEMILSDSDSYADVEIIFSGWGCPDLDEAFLAALPALRAIFYGAGSVKSLVTNAFWNRDIVLTSSYGVNAVPVAEYTVSAINLSLKYFWHYAQAIRDGGELIYREHVPGFYRGSKVGIISLGAIGRLVCEGLKQHQVDVFAYDPVVGGDVFDTCGAAQVSSLEWLFRECDVVSLHAPWIPETEGMVTYEMLASMKPRATFINTSRGMLVDEKGMVQALKERPDLHVVLDVIQDESDYQGSRIAKLPNVTMTPHVAGSTGRECHRMGQLAIDECVRYLRGESLQSRMTDEIVQRLA